MAMMQPIPPNDSATSVWEAIDIFLFSNGQQYSPPRKYHLRSEELKWWDATLSYLARAHYGSLHSSIEIYSTNGSRILTPLELNNGVAYVAVVPPDSFIAAGYDKYLVKASRSWEKSLQKKAEALKTSKGDDEDRSVEEMINEKLQMENTNPHAGSPGNLTVSTQERKQSSGGRSSLFSRRISANVKPSEVKKKPNKIPIPIPQTTRNSINNTTTKTADPKRSYFRRKESSDEKNSKQTELGMTKQSINGTITTVSKVVTSSIVTTKDLQIQNNNNETTNKKVSDTDKEQIFYHNPEKDALSSCFEPNITQQTPGAAYDANLNRRVSQTYLVKISEESLKTEDIFKNIIKHVVERVFTFKSRSTVDQTTNQAVNKEHAVDVVDTKLCPASCNNNPNLDSIGERIVTIIKKGDSVNLKVNIDIQQEKTSASDSDLSKPETPSHAKKERGSQTNVNLEFKKTPSLNMKHNTNLDEQNMSQQGNYFTTRQTQVVVVQCSCSYPYHSMALNELHAVNNTSKHLCKNNTKYVLVPADFLDEYQCCNCVQKVTSQRAQTESQKQRPEDPAVNQDKTSVRSSIKFTGSTTSVAARTHTNIERINCNEPVVKIADHKEARYDEEITLTCKRSASVVFTEDPFIIPTPQTDPVIKNTDQNDVKRCCQTKKIGNGDIVAVDPTRNEPEYVITKTYFDSSQTRREYIVTKHLLQDDSNEKRKPSYFIKRQEDTELPLSTHGQRTEFLVLRKQQPKNMVHVSTQTDWCDTLLQTKVNEDGHYSFHLPTLQILRQYKL